MGCTIGKISNVQITKVTNDKVSFTTDGKVVGTTAHSPSTDKRISGSFTCPRGDVWPTEGGVTDGITTEPSVKLVAGAIGPLYLEDSSLQQPGSSARGPCVIRGCVKPLLSDEVAIPLKWPNCGGLDDDARLDLVPTGIRVVGYVEGKSPASVNLLDPKFAMATQDIDLQSTVGITLQLTPKGFDAFHASVTNGAKLTVWPVKIEIVGRPVSGNGHPASIDLRDQTLAHTVQRLRWDTQGATVSVRATCRGFATFGVVSDDVRMAAELISGLRRTNQKAFAAIQILWQAHQAMAHARARGHEIYGPEFAAVIDLLATLTGHQCAQ